jgi:RNA recognition motif-containing protein
VFAFFCLLFYLSYFLFLRNSSLFLLRFPFRKSANIATRDNISRGFGYVEMGDVRAAEDACRKLNGQDLEGSNIRVEFARGPGREQPRSEPGGFFGNRRNFRRQFRRFRSYFNDRRPYDDYESRAPPRYREGEQDDSRPPFPRRRYDDYDRRPAFDRSAEREEYDSRPSYPRRRYDDYDRRPQFDRSREQEEYGSRPPYRPRYEAPYPPYPYPPYRPYRFHRYLDYGFFPRFRPRRRFWSDRPFRARRPRREIDPDAPVSGTQIHLSNLPYNLTKEELIEAFAGYRVRDVVIPHRRFNTSLNIGYGFLDFETEEDQKRALAEHSEITIKDRTCKITAARPLPPQPPAEEAK